MITDWPTNAFVELETMTRICSVQDCGEVHDSRGYCHKHYVEARRNGLERVLPETRYGCDYPGCPKPHRSKGYCVTHLWRVNKYGTPELPERHRVPCAYSECTNTVARSGYCKLCNTQISRYGTPVRSGPLKGADHPNWVGDGVGYFSAHARIARTRGAASEHQCMICGSRAEDWALRRDPLGPVHVQDGMTFSTNVDDYLPLCKLDHAAYDERSEKLRQSWIKKGADDGA